MTGVVMKNHAICYVMFILFSAVFAPARADAAAFTMGRMQAVASDGSLDATRNPSLLTALNTDNSIGVLLLYAPLARHRYSYNYYGGMSLQRGGIDDARYNAGSVILSYCRKVPAGAIGLALDTDDRYGGVAVRYRRLYSGFSSAGVFHNEITGQSMRMAPRFVFSFGGAVKGEHSLGVQVAAGYSYFRDDTDFVTWLNYRPNQKHHSSKRTEEARAELSFGYSYRNADSQAGLMLRSGRFAWQKTKIYFSHVDLGPPMNLPVPYQLLYAGSVSEPYAFKYDRAFSIIGGGYHRPAKYIALSLEGEFQAPITYNIKDLRFDETTYYFGMSHNLAVTRSGLICVRAGLEIMPPGPVAIGLGGSVRYVREKTRGSDYRQTVRTEEYAGTLGLDVRAADNLLIMAGSRLTYTRERGRTSIQYEYIGSSSNDGLTSLLHVDCFIGTSAGF